MNKVYEIINDRILEQLEKGEIPWKKPWQTQGELPVNLASGKPYRGINIILLTMAGHASPYWVTFKQAKKLGGHVKKGATAMPVLFWKICERETDKKDEDGKPITEKYPVARYYSVFNVEQCKGIDYPKPDKKNHEPIKACEKLVDGMKDKPPIEHAGSRAFYRPSTDSITVPEQGFFDKIEGYYSTLFHELVHSTGHESRIKRAGVTDGALFGSEKYSKEELIAEFGACFLCGIAGIETKTIENSAAYIQSWKKRITDEPKLLIHASANAQKAVDYIQGHYKKRGDN